MVNVGMSSVRIHHGKDSAFLKETNINPKLFLYAQQVSKRHFVLYTCTKKCIQTIIDALTLTV